MTKSNDFAVSAGAGPSANVFVGIFGFSLSQSTILDTNENICSTVNQCFEAGFGFHGGGGIEGVINIGSPLESGTAESIGGFVRFFTTGGSVDFNNSGVNAGRGFNGGGTGAAAGIRFCQQTTNCVPKND